MTPPISRTEEKFQVAFVPFETVGSTAGGHEAPTNEVPPNLPTHSAEGSEAARQVLINSRGMESLLQGQRQEPGQGCCWSWIQAGAEAKFWPGQGLERNAR